MSSEISFIDAGDVRFRIARDGSTANPPLMFSNSLGATLEMWDAQIPVFAETHRVIRYDVRGHGGSSCPPGPYSLAMLAQDALRILDTLHIHKADWVGCSMGGMVGMYLLTYHPDRINRAVLGNTAAFMGPPFTDWNARIRLAHREGMGAIAEAMKMRWFTPAFNQSNPGEVARITDQVREATVTGYTACCAALRDMDQREAIKSISNPVLVVIGEKDIATTPAMGEIMVSNIPGAKKAVVPGSHIANCESPADYNRVVAAFLGTA
ncbi:3-oxoadipate enol-lactonase [Rhabdaerophilum sp. SD176]|uniref:3-oxoadipate enol-lactonase n=1 Tax=Rhabdaerophilum sp. SD176 TaxID=2983548 RepID=UPI0024DFCDB7|nr:3-oxoadipate enol-lactonase [Rhabdaerophilum sp. SD176]